MSLQGGPNAVGPGESGSATSCLEAGDYDAAWNRRDSLAVGAALSPGYVYFSSTGRVVTREGALEFLRSPEYRLAAAERSEVRVTHASPEAAVVASRWRGHGTWRGESFRDDQRCSLVLHRTRGGGNAYRGGRDDRI